MVGSPVFSARRRPLYTIERGEFVVIYLLLVSDLLSRP